MSFRKLTSRSYEQAIQRVAGLKAISDALDLGNDLTVVSYQTAIDDLKTTVDSYNTLLAQADTMQNAIRLKEKQLRDYSERMLLGVAARYGKNSDEYEKAGGTKKSKRRRIVRKSATA